MFFFVVLIDLERDESFAYIPTSGIKIIQFTSKIYLVSWIDVKVSEKRFLEGMRDLKAQKNKNGVKLVDFNYKKESLNID